MIKLNVKVVDSDGSKFIKTLELDDNYTFGKLIPEFKEVIDSVCKDSKLENIDDVLLRVNFDW